MKTIIKPAPMIRYKIYFFTIVLLFAATGNVFSQTSTVPPEAKGNTAPFLFTPETVKSGETIYNLNCKSCHGDPGKGNHAALTPIPKDPASAEYQKNTDGEIFYILSNGRGLMPNFVNTLNEEQRWQVISYVRSFNKDYKQPPVKVKGEGVKTETAKMVLSFDPTKNQVFAVVTDSLKGIRKPLKDVSVKLFVKRTFGNLLVSQASTDINGTAYFSIPSDIPGDTVGTLHLIAKADGSGKELAASIDQKIGVPVKSKLLLSQRAWWNVNKMAPIWLIFLYTSGVIGVLATVLYVLLQLRKIKKNNQNK